MRTLASKEINGAPEDGTRGCPLVTRRMYFSTQHTHRHIGIKKKSLAVRHRNTCLQSGIVETETGG